MKPSLPKALPPEIQSPSDARNLSSTAAKHRLAALGTFVTKSAVIIATTLGMTFCILLDMALSGQVGRMYFEPMPGEPSDSLFGAKTILAGVLLSAFVLHLSTLNKNTSGVMRLIDKWAPRFALLFIAGATGLLFSAMSKGIHPTSGGWETETPLVSQLINGFNENFAAPVAQELFAIGFAPLLVGSIFALSKLFEWWLGAVKDILHQVTHSGAIQSATQRIKKYRTEYRSKAALYNAGKARTKRDREQAFALMLYQTSAKAIAALQKQVNKSQGDGFPSLNECADGITQEDVNAMKKALSYKAILAAIRGEE